MINVAQSGDHICAYCDPHDNSIQFVARFLQFAAGKYTLEKLMGFSIGFISLTCLPVYPPLADGQALIENHNK